MRPLPIFTLTLAMLLWSSSFIALKHVLDVWSFGQVLFLRMGVASGCWLLCYRQLGKFSYRKGDWRWLALMGALEPCLYFLLEVNALRYTSAGQAGMVCALLPLMVALVAFVLLKERVSRRQLLGFAIAIFGIALLGLGGVADEFAPNALLGNSLEMGAMLCAATYSVVFKKLSSRYGVMTLTALQAFVGTLFFAPFAFSAPWPSAWSWQDMAVIVFLGAFVTLGAYLLYNWSVTQVKVTLAAAYVNLIPVFTLLLAYLLLGETLNSLQWLACAAVLAGIGVGQLPTRRRRERAAATES
ncbi:DMT family transporter [Aeromonas aquatica]|uniref:DMT family transporter n=1 Tax=Aeromonas aquatica TaxID=558964 RepID=UPI00286F6BBD|nr:DMT family transporter [Aeromonas aquatica]